MNAENRHQLITLLARYTEVPTDEITDDMGFRDDLELNSIDFLTLVGDIEETFGITADLHDAESIVSVGDAIACVDLWISRKEGTEDGEQK